MFQFNLMTTRMSINFKEESPYKPEAFDSRSFRAIAHGIAHKVLFYLIIFRNPVSPLYSAFELDFVF